MLVAQYVVSLFLLVHCNALNTKFITTSSTSPFLTFYSYQFTDEYGKDIGKTRATDVRYTETKGNDSVANETRSGYCGQGKIVGRSIFFIILLTSILVIGTVGNCSAIAVIILSKNLRSQPTNTFIVSLAISDLGALLFVTSLRINTQANNQNFCYNLTTCKMFNVTDIIFHIGSVSHLFVIAIERFIAINKPFFHRAYMTTRATLFSVLAVWTYSIVWSITGVFRWDTPYENEPRETMLILENLGHRVCLFNNKYFFTVIYLVIYLIPLFVMAFLYAYILRTALKQSRAIASLEHAQVADTGGISIRKKKREFRATKTLAIVYGAFLICWFPLTIIVLSSNWCEECYARLPELGIVIIISLFRDSLPPLNSCLNPFIYIIFNTQFRNAFKKLLYKTLGRNVQHLESAAESSSQLRSRIRGFRYSRNVRPLGNGMQPASELDTVTENTSTTIVPLQNIPYAYENASVDYEVVSH